MATIGPVTLTISRMDANAVVKVGYTISADTRDVMTAQPYREICRLIGDDTPETAADDIIPGGTLRRATTVFTDSNTEFTRILQKTLPASALDEDNEGPALDVDEIRAVVTLTPLGPTARSRESNQVLFNVLENTTGSQA